MIAQMQKRARGISRVGRRLFPNLHVTGLPPAWVELLGDPITALDRFLASVTSVPAPDSEGNSTGTMSDSPPPHTFRRPQQSLVSPRIAHDPAMAVIQRQAPGISRVGRRLFPDLGGTGLPPAWSQFPGDPITALDGGLASVTSVPIPDSEESSTGTMSDSPPPHTFRQLQQSLAPSQIAYDPAIAMTQKQAPGISGVGSRLFPDWSEVPGDPITALDRGLASVTSVPTPDSEGNSTGTMSDSPPPHTFPQPQPSPVSSQIAYDPAIAMTQKQAPGISGVGSRLFPDWSEVPGDPITALDRGLASITSVPIPDSEENSTGTMSDSPPPHTFRQPQPSPVSSQIAYDPASVLMQRQAPGISRVGSRLFPDWSQVRSDPITALDRGLASVTSVPMPDPEENSTGTMSDSPPPHTFRQPQQSPVRSQIANDPASVLMQRQAPGISRVGSRLFPDWSQVWSDPITALDGRLASVTAHTRASETPTENTRGETAAPPNFFAFDADTSPPPAGHGQSASPTALQPADISPGFRSSGVSIVGPPKPNFAAAGRSSSLPKDQSGRTKLVPFSRLAEMLQPGGPADESRTDPQSLESTEAEQTALAGSYPSSQAVTVEAVLEQLEQRLQFEFLRMYGSSGE